RHRGAGGPRRPPARRAAGRQRAGLADVARQAGAPGRGGLNSLLSAPMRTFILIAALAAGCAGEAAKGPAASTTTPTAEASPPPPAAECPASVQEGFKGQGGACLDPSVLG